MAKRMTKAESKLIMWALIIGLPIYKTAKGQVERRDIPCYGFFILFNRIVLHS